MGGVLCCHLLCESEGRVWLGTCLQHTRGKVSGGICNNCVSYTFGSIGKTKLMNSVSGRGDEKLYNNERCVRYHVRKGYV